MCHTPRPAHRRPQKNPTPMRTAPRYNGKLNLNWLPLRGCTQSSLGGTDRSDSVSVAASNSDQQIYTRGGTKHGVVASGDDCGGSSTAAGGEEFLPRGAAGGVFPRDAGDRARRHVSRQVSVRPVSPGVSPSSVTRCQSVRCHLPSGTAGEMTLMVANLRLIVIL